MVTADPALDVWIDASNWGGPFTVNVNPAHLKPGNSMRTVSYLRTRGLSAARPANLLTAAASMGDLLAGDGGPSAYACMRDTHGVKGGIIGTQDAAITKAQMKAVTGGGGGLLAYVYLYFAGNPEAQVGTAIERCAGFPVQKLVLDCEDPFAENMTEAAVVDWIGRAARACENRISSAIYTAPYWWKRQTGNSEAFKSFPLHHASADSNGNLDPVDYGGWVGQPYIEQYAFDQNLCGVNVDLNVMARVATPVPKPQPAGPVLKSSRIEYSGTTGLYSIVNEIGWEAGQ